MNKKRKILTLAAFALALGVGAGISAFTETKTATATTETPILEIYKKNLSFKESIYILYAIDAQNVATTDEFGLLVWNTPQESYEYETATAVVTDKYTATISGATYPTFYYTDLVAKEMTDVVYSRAYVKRDGEYYYSDVDKYSILEYAYNKLGKTDKEATTDTQLKALLESMLAYGGAAQIYTDYKTDTLANDDFIYVQIVNAKFEDGFDYGLYKAGTQVKVIPDEGYALGGNAADYYSTDENGNIILTVPQTIIDEDTTGGSFEEIPQTSQGLLYTLNSDGVSYSVKKGDCTDSVIVIPDTYEGLPVTVISIGAFYNCQDLTSVTIGDNVTTIQGSAFYNCSNLSEIFIPDSVTTIQENVFSYCHNLTIYCEGQPDSCNINYVFPIVWDYAGIKGETEGFVWAQTKYNTIGITDYTGTVTELLIPSTINGYPTTILNRAFAECNSLTSVTISDGICSIGIQAFYGCKNLERVVISDSVISIGLTAFGSCESLTSVELGNGVRTIDVQAFSGCTQLTSIIIPETVTFIGINAFSYCTNLTNVTFANPNGWTAGDTAVSSTDLANTQTAATYLKSTYCSYYWTRKDE